MTEFESFSTDDQITLMRTPNALAMAAAYVEQDGFLSIRKELKAALQASIDGATAFPDNQIIQRIALEMNSVNQEQVEETRERAKTAAVPEDLMEERNPATSRPVALQLAADSLAIMSANATEQETVEFKYWLYSIADQVTIASKAGGFMGFGGTQVTPAEAKFLDELRDALDIPDDNVHSTKNSIAQAVNENAPAASVEPAPETEDERIARLDAASVRADEPVAESVPVQRPEDI